MKSESEDSEAGVLTVGELVALDSRPVLRLTPEFLLWLGSARYVLHLRVQIFEQTDKGRWRAIEYALFVGHPLFSGTEETVAAKLKRLTESETNLVVKLKADSFDFIGLAVAKTSKAKARILVDENLEIIESIELI